MDKKDLYLRFAGLETEELEKRLAQYNGFSRGPRRDFGIKRGCRRNLKGARRWR